MHDREEFIEQDSDHNLLGLGSRLHKRVKYKESRHKRVTPGSGSALTKMEQNTSPILAQSTRFSMQNSFARH
jgi:hypothetical protein